MVKYVAGFATTQGDHPITFENCINKGTIEGANSNVAGFVTVANLKTPKNITFQNSENQGTIIKTVSAETGAAQIVAGTALETVNFAGANANGTLDTSLTAMTLTGDAGSKSITFTGAPAGVAYFKVVHLASLSYQYNEDGMFSGMLFYNEKLNSDVTNYTLKTLRFINSGETIDDATRVYGNPNIGLIGGEFVYDDTNLAKAVKGPNKVVVFAYNAEHKPIGYSNALDVSKW